MFSHDTTLENAVAFSRFDRDHFLSTHSDHAFELEDKRWPSVEHYYQTKKYEGTTYGDKIFHSATAGQAYKLGNCWWRKKRGDFTATRKTLMTRALYSKAVQYPEIAEQLLATGEQMLIENSAYEHYWGIGRDQRGENHLGKIWMDIRTRLKEKGANNG